jgi:hypothetical protein
MRRRAGLAILAAGLVCALAPASTHASHAIPSPTSPGDGTQVTARQWSPVFEAQGPPGLILMQFRVSTSPTTVNGLLAVNANTVSAAEVPGQPGTYRGQPSSAAAWFKTPATYYWQANAIACDFTAHPGFDCDNPSVLRTLTIKPLPPPVAVSPPNGAVVPINSTQVFQVADVEYQKDGIVSSTPGIEFAVGTRRDADGSFADADSRFSGTTLSAGPGLFEYRLTYPFTSSVVAGTWYWMPYRTDSYAGRSVGEVRSFTIGNITVPPQGGGGGGGGPVPELEAFGRTRQRLLRQGGLVLTFRCPVACSVMATGGLRIGGRRYRLHGLTRSLTAGQDSSFKLRASRALRRKVRRALNRRRRVRGTFRARVIYSGGRQETATYALRVIR